MNDATPGFIGPPGGASSTATVARGIIGGIAGAAGDPQTQQEMVVANQRAAQQKQAELQAKVAPLSLGIKNLQTGIQSAYGQYQQANPDWKGDFDAWKTGPGAQQFGQFVDQTSQATHALRQVLHPDWQPGPDEWLKTHLTDRLYITNADHRADDQSNDQAWNQYTENQGTQRAVNAATPWDQSPASLPERLKAKNALGLANAKANALAALEDQKQSGQQTLEEKKAADALKLDAQKETQRDKTETEKAQLAEKREDDRLKMFSAAQARLERQHDAGAGAIGTWAVQEDANGKPVLFNSKTGQTKDAPEGMHKSGYFVKQIAPLEAASQNIKSYIDGGAFTGPGDLDLQHQYFAATQPPSGFRMTKQQQDTLKDSQSLMNRLKAGAAHLTGGTIFSEEQRRQIADEAQKAIIAKQKTLRGEPQDVFPPAGAQTKQLQGVQGAPSDDDIIKALGKK